MLNDVIKKYGVDSREVRIFECMLDNTKGFFKARKIKKFYNQLMLTRY